MLRRIPRLYLALFILIAGLFAAACAPPPAVAVDPAAPQTPAPTPQPAYSTYAFSTLDDFRRARYGSAYAAFTYADLSDAAADELVAVTFFDESGFERPVEELIYFEDFYGGRVDVYALERGEVFCVYSAAIARGEELRLYLSTDPATGKSCLLRHTSRAEKDGGEESLRLFRLEGDKRAYLENGAWREEELLRLGGPYSMGRDADGQSVPSPAEGGSPFSLCAAPATAAGLIAKSEPLLVCGRSDPEFSFLHDLYAGRFLKADLDGDGALDHADIARVQYQNYAFVTVSLANGASFSARLDNVADGARLSLSSGDIDGDGRAELAACALGRRGEAASAAVFDLADGALQTLPPAFAPREEAHLSFIPSYGEGILEARIVGDALCVKVPLDAGQDPALLVSARYENGAWRILEEGFTYGAAGVFTPYLSYLPLLTPLAGENYRYARALYAPPRLVFEGAYEGFDENERRYDASLGAVHPSPKERVELGMRFLYELCGALPDTVYVKAHKDALVCSTAPGGSIFFAIGMDDSFYETGYTWAYRKEGLDSPIDPEAPGFLKPGRVADRDVLALWYYENLPLPGKKEVVRIASAGFGLYLYAADGTYFFVDFTRVGPSYPSSDRSAPGIQLPYRILGPYRDG